MASDLRKKTQEAIDLLRDCVDGCDLAMLVDGDTGLVLSKSSKDVIPQNLLDQLARSAQAELDAPLTVALPELANGAETLTAMQVGKDEVVTVLKSLRFGTDVIVCKFDAIPNLSDLTDAADTIFTLSSDAEAA